MYFGISHNVNCTSFKLFFCFYIPGSCDQVFFYLLILLPLIHYIVFPQMFVSLKVSGCILIACLGCPSSFFSSNENPLALLAHDGLDHRTWICLTCCWWLGAGSAAGLARQWVACLLGIYFHSWHGPCQNCCLLEICSLEFVVPFLVSHGYHGFILLLDLYLVFGAGSEWGGS